MQMLFEVITAAEAIVYLSRLEEEEEDGETVEVQEQKKKIFSWLTEDGH